MNETRVENLYMSSYIKKHLFLTRLVVAKQNSQQTELSLSPFAACHVVQLYKL